MANTTPEEKDFAQQALDKLNPSTTVPSTPVDYTGNANSPVLNAPLPQPLPVDNSGVPASIAAPLAAPEFSNAPTPQDSVPASIAAPAVTNAVQPKTTNFAPAIPQGPSISTANPLTGLKGKDARTNEINSKFDAAKADTESQLNALRSASEDGKPDPNYAVKAGALQAKLGYLDKQKAEALSGNESKFSMYKTDENGDTHLDANGIPKNLTPIQVAAYKAKNVMLEQGNQDNAFKRQKAGIDAEQAANTTKDMAIAAGNQKIATQLQSDANDQQKRMAVQKVELQKRQDDADQAIKQYNNSSIDESQFWKKTPAGNQIALAIMAGLTGAFNGLNHVAGNSVVDSVNRAIANNIDEQKVNLAKAGHNVDLKNNAVATFMKQGYDQEQAIALSKAALLDATKAQVEANVSQSNSDITKARGAQMIAQLDQQRDQARAQALQPYVDAQIKSNQVVPTVSGQKGFSPAVLNGGVWQVKNLATGKVTEATGEQVAQAKGLQKTDAETNKLNNGAGGKVSPKIAVKLSEHDNALDKITQFSDAYGKGTGLNVGTFDPEYQQKRKDAAEALSKVNGKTIADNEHDLSEAHIGPRLKVIANDLNKSRERLVGEAKNSGQEVQGSEDESK